MIYYSSLLLLYIIFSLTSINPKSKNKRIIYISLLLLPAFLLVALRSTNVGADTFPYSYTYDRIVKIESFKDLLNASYMESGFVFAMYAFGKLGFSYYGFQVVCAILFFLIFTYFFYKHSKNPAFSCFLLLTTNALFGMMNQTRMWIACCIFVFAVEKLLKKEYIKYIAIIAIASFIHTSILITYLILPFLYLYNKNKQITIFTGFIISFILLAGSKTIFSGLFGIFGKYGDYLNDDVFSFTSASVIYFLEYFSIYLFSTLIIKKRSISNTNTKTIYSTVQFDQCMVFLLMLLSIIGLGNSYITRVSSYFLVYVLVFLTELISEIKNKTHRTLLMLFLIAVFTAEFYVILIYRSNWDRVLPYEFFFN